ncbi:MAG TPA: sugar phosphate nucleotidyltransferase [Acidimicrobiales bacterium]|nr:sugar phosphate nucleotidyltransferase [Acidimicrobiales bacterium]
MKAVIMAGGEGTRLRPLTYNQPKPMIPMANRALMEHVVALLRRHGFNEIVVTVGFQANAIQTYFGNGVEFGVDIVYASEETPLGTAGSVRNAMQQLGEPFLVISGDVLTDIDLSALVDFHYEKKAVGTMALRSVANPLEFGIVMVAKDGSVERFLEKPSWGQVFSDTINTGIYVFEPEIFDYIGPGEVDFSSEVFPRLVAEGQLLYGYLTEGYWEDIGTLEAYARAHQDILDSRVRAELPGFALRGGIWLGEGAEVDPGAEVRGPAIIGDYCSVQAGATLGEYTVLGRNVRVGADAYLERAIVHDNAYLGPGVRLRGCTIGRSSDLRRGARIEEGVVVGDECFIGEHAVVHAGVRIYPFKTVEHGAIVNSSIVWESRGARHLFGRTGVSGLANVDISPELAVRLAMAYATTMPRGAKVTVSRDTSRAARMLKQSVMAGLNAGGVDVADLEVATVPVTRFGVRSERAAGGVTVRLFAEDTQSVMIGFFDPNGVDIPEALQRKVERIFYREDFRRCLASETGDISYPVRVPDLYSRTLLEQVDIQAIRSARFKVVLDYAYGATSFVMPAVLGMLGAEVLSVNPYAATRQFEAFDRWEHARGVSALVRAAGAHFGAVLGPDGERITLVDDNGRVLSDSEGLMALLSLVLGTAPGPASGGPASVRPASSRPASSRPASSRPASGGPASGGPARDLDLRVRPHIADGPDGVARDVSIALPVSAPTPAQDMCRRAGAELVWTKLSTSHLMEVASRPGVEFAAGQEGGYIFPRFLPAYDAVSALAHTFTLLAATSARLSNVVASLPSVFAAHEAVVTPWEKKGLVMRSVMELGRDKPMVLVDGVKVIYEDGWSLVVPDPEEALTHIWAEASTETGARTRAQDYARRVRNLLRS